MRIFSIAAGIFVLWIVITLSTLSVGAWLEGRSEINITDYEQVLAMVEQAPLIKDEVIELAMSDCINVPAPCISKREKKLIDSLYKKAKQKQLKEALGSGKIEDADDAEANRAREAVTNALGT